MVALRSEYEGPNLGFGWVWSTHELDATVSVRWEASRVLVGAPTRARKRPFRSEIPHGAFRRCRRIFAGSQLCIRDGNLGDDWMIYNEPSTATSVEEMTVFYTSERIRIVRNRKLEKNKNASDLHYLICKRLSSKH